MHKIEMDWETEEQPLAVLIDELKREPEEVRILKLQRQCGDDILAYMKVIQVANENYNPPYDKKEAHTWIVDYCGKSISQIKQNQLEVKSEQKASKRWKVIAALSAAIAAIATVIALFKK